MKKLLFLFSLLTLPLIGISQSIGIVGTAVGSWDVDVVMATSDNVHYTLNNHVFAAGQAKFRQDGAWTTNWGANAFPTGTGTQNGANIPVPAGTYTVTFNRTTGEYTFSGTSTFASISMVGLALQGWDTDVDMATTDGVTYTLQGYTFSTNEGKFRQDHMWTNNWGDVAFPSGTAVFEGSNIQIQAGTYTVTFNKNTLAYNFGYVTISVLGTATPGLWESDTDLFTTDGIEYSAIVPLTSGEIKFRQDHSWDFNWGGAGTSGTGEAGGANIAISDPGNYVVTFNRNTLGYAISPSLGTTDADRVSFASWPNPSKSIWNVSSNAAIEAISISDLSGKTVLESKPQSSQTALDLGSLASGMYFAKVKAGTSVQTIRLIKQ